MKIFQSQLEDTTPSGGKDQDGGVRLRLSARLLAMSVIVGTVAAVATSSAGASSPRKPLAWYQASVKAACNRLLGYSEDGLTEYGGALEERGR